MTSDPRLTVDTVAEAMADLGPAEAAGRNRVRIPVAANRLHDALVRARNRLKCDHLIQIATVDTGSAIELHYHLTGPHRTVVTIRVALSRVRPRIASAHGLLPPAGLYERQIHDLFGVEFDGHPDLRRIILNEDWPEGEYPLRKDWKKDPGTFYGGLPEEGH